MPLAGVGLNGWAGLNLAATAANRRSTMLSAFSCSVCFASNSIATTSMPEAKRLPDAGCKNCSRSAPIDAGA